MQKYPRTGETLYSGLRYSLDCMKTCRKQDKEPADNNFDKS